MPEKPTYEELEQRVRELEKAASERIKSEDALRNTQKLFRALYEQAPVGIAIIDSRTGKFLDINDAYCRIIGYSRSRMLEMDFMKITHPDDLQEDLDNMGRLRAGEISRFQMEKRYFRRGGSVVWVSLTVVPLWRDAAEPMHHIAIVEDITERKRSEEALKASEQKFRNITENMPGMVLKYKLNPDGSDELLYISKGVADLFEVSREDAVNNNKLLWDCIHKDDLEEYAVSIKESAENLSSWEQEHRVQLPDGKVKWVYTCGVPSKQEDGGVIWDTLAFDITERKRVEAELERSKVLLEATGRMARVGGWELDAETSAVSWTEEIYRIHGVPLEYRPQLKEALDFYPPDDRKVLSEAIKRALDQGEPCDLELRFITAKGDPLWVRIISNPIIENEKVTRLPGTFQDVTDRKNTELALKKSEERHKKISALATDYFYELNVDDERLIFIEWVSDSFERVTTYNRDEMKEFEKWMSKIHPDDLADLQQKTADLLANKPVVNEYRFKTRNGDTRWLVDRLIPEWSEEQNRVVKAYGAVRDITARKRTEEALQASLAQKEVLLREIHHRVKNNMQTIVGLLRMHARRIDDAQLTEIFNDCRDRIGAMSLIHEALYQSDDLAKIDFKAYLKKLCRNLAQAHDAGKRGVTLTASAEDVSMNMDQGVAVGMVIAELISNAFKHAFPDGGGGTVSVGLDRPDGETVRLAVSDTGKGLPPDFDMSASSSLGMRLVWGAVTRELGGSIEAANDGGAKFVIRFKMGNSVEK